MFYDSHLGNGTISRPGNADVRFTADRIIGRDRTLLKMGDMVWFEIENMGSNFSAINIRKC